MIVDEMTLYISKDGKASIVDIFSGKLFYSHIKVYIYSEITQNVLFAQRSPFSPRKCLSLHTQMLNVHINNKIIWKKVL